jgi:hypothetical protein
MAKQMRCLLAGLHCADGSEACQPGGEDPTELSAGVIYTSSRRFRDEVVRAALHAGYSVNCYRHREAGDAAGFGVTTEDSWDIKYTPIVRESTPTVTRQDVTSMYRDELVWCVTLPTIERQVGVVDAEGQPVTKDGAVVTTAAPTNLICVRSVKPDGGVSRPCIVGNCGTLLMEEAERVAKEEHGSWKVAVISGVGTRHYYRKLGYHLDGPYMSKVIHTTQRST